MLFYLHYCLMTSGLSGTSVLLAVYFQNYTDASQSEIGALLMTLPFVSLIIKPVFCAMADRHQAHRLYLLLALILETLGYLPYLIIPFFPSFYMQHPRASWYILVAACHVGSGGLGVAWSLGDCLAVNHSQRTGVPFGRMRLFGTLSWGVFGLIIGLINEMPGLPKYVPAFLILHINLVLEFIMVFVWDKEAFIMVDTLAEYNATKSIEVNESHELNLAIELQEMCAMNSGQAILVNSLPSSLGGSLRLLPTTASVLRDVLASTDQTDQLHRRLRKLQERREGGDSGHVQMGPCRKASSIKSFDFTHQDQSKAKQAAESAGIGETNGKSKQLILLKMILLEDGRVIKYAALFVIFGLLMAPMNFVFLSIEENSREYGYNFSLLAGAVLISQALSETVSFLMMPWCMTYISKWVALSAGLIIMSTKYYFYGIWYYGNNMSPYWALLAEWSHGISYGIFCTIQADVALMFANESRVFISDLRKMGYMSQVDANPSTMTPAMRAKIEAEENAVKMALRATMSSLFSGLMDGLGQGCGSLICGIFIQKYSYTRVWGLIATIATVSILVHLLIELSRCRWSDRFKPQPGTTAHELMQLSKAVEDQQRRRASSSTDRQIVVTSQAISIEEKPPKKTASAH